MAVALLLGSVPASRAESPSDYFETHIRPVLSTSCFRCHGDKKQKGGLRVDSRPALIAGGESGAAIVPGKPGASLLVRALRHEGPEMPPKERLPETTVERFEAWIAAGAEWPETSEGLRVDMAEISTADRDWWAFRPLAAVEPPEVSSDLWSRNPIDRFIFRRLEEAGLQPASRADRSTLVRRLFFDVLGVPPTTSEIDAFVSDDSADAWARLVDRLLADERYGERWASFWLDLVRYSDSDGWNQDAFRPHIWRYRDYVIKAFNEDKPYPEFVREQIAGDEVARDDPSALAAVGFLRLGIFEYNQRDARGHWNDIVNEMTDVVGDAFLGLSLGCARCHDHKFDPIPQKDYFRLRAFFDPVVWRDDIPGATREQQELHREQLASWEAATKDVRADLDALLDPYRERKWKSTVAKFPLDIQACFRKPAEERTSWEEQMAYLVSRQYLEEGGGPFKSLKEADGSRREALEKRLAAFDSLKPPALPSLMTVTDWQGEISPTVVPGDSSRQPVAPGYLSVLSRAVDASRAGGDASVSSRRRTALARWIARPDNPLTTRVIVNRIWQRHFGRGIVGTPSNFGKTGEKPTHPELLDWLTRTFIEGGWRFKRLHRWILTSETWMQSATHPRAREQELEDPGDRWFWRAPVRRLSAEQIRDALLAVSGELEQQVGGASVDEKHPRRGLYVKRFRNRTETFLHVFDAAAGLKSVDDRGTTTTPTQALLLVNGDYALGRARAFARRIAGLELGTRERIVAATLSAWGRRPSPQELSSAIEFVKPQGAASIDPERWADLCHVLLNSNAFLYID